jgi:hypothetical protein
MKIRKWLINYIIISRKSPTSKLKKNNRQIKLSMHINNKLRISNYNTHYKERDLRM